MPQFIEVKSILNKAKKRSAWFLDDYTINPSSGCSFNCLFCYIRGSKYGAHMEDKLSIKTNAPEVLEKQLYNQAKKGQFGFIVLASATEPYSQFESDLKITRQLLEIILRYRFPVHILTRSDLVIRDFDLLQQIDKTAILPVDLRSKTKHGAFITFSFSSIDSFICKVFEPGATPPEKRLNALKTSFVAGFKTGVSLMPLLPYISDTGEHLELMFDTFSRAGASYIFPSTITLFGKDNSDSKTLVLRAVKKHYPHLTEKYIKLFTNSDYMPSYYQSAFNKKTKELSLKYNLKNSLLH